MLSRISGSAEALLDYEKLRYLYAGVPIIVGMHTISLVLFTLILLDNVDSLALGVWFALSGVIILFRIYHYFMFVQNGEEVMDEAQIWLHRYYTYILIAGGLWGSTAFLLFPDSGIMQQMIVVLFILGMTSTAIGIISASWYLVIAFALLSFAPIILRLGWMGDPIYQTLVYIIAALGILMIFTAKHFGRVIDLSLRSQLELSEVQNDLRLLEKRFISLLDNAPISVFYYDTGLNLKQSNRSFLDLMEIPDQEALGSINLGSVDNRALQALHAALQGQEGEYHGPFYASASGKTYHVELATVPLMDERNEVNGALGILKDLTGEYEAKEEIRQNAFYDPLTRLPNRILFTDRLNVSLEQSRRHFYHCAVLYLDVDHFKHINDTLGHYIGDQLLRQVSRRLLERVRGEDTVARVGGDEFLVLLNSLSSDFEEAKREAMDLAADLIDLVHGTFYIDAHEVITSVSIGVVMFPGDYEDVNLIIKHADVAMYQAKRTGRNHAELYHPEHERHQKAYITMESALRQAVEEHQFELYFQPKVSLQTEKIEQVEALLRWNHPEKGIVYPDDFISFAEESGLIIRIGEWVLEECARQIKIWEAAEMSIESVSVNVSALQFAEPHFIDFLKALVMLHDIPPQKLELELTESVMLNEQTVYKLENLKEYGFHIALDDFGTGYSSLSYLRHLPIHGVKIDRSFISGLEGDSDSLMLVRTIIAIAKNFNLTVIAEGVETEEEYRILKELECDYYQGFYCQKALRTDELEQLLLPDQIKKG